jgi:hypothetical protein
VIKEGCRVWLRSVTVYDARCRLVDIYGVPLIGSESVDPGSSAPEHKTGADPFVVVSIGAYLMAAD